MARKMTDEQKQKYDEKMSNLRMLWSKVSAMSEEERQKFGESLPTVVNCEGHALSVNNTILLSYQRQNVTVVGGFKQWLSMGRVVNKGEHSLSIWFPAKKKDGDEDEVRFFFGNVFDISQTVELEK